MTVPHDPAHHARLTYVWRDQHWHLLDEPQPTVVLLSETRSEGRDYPTPHAAETAFWSSVVDSILSARPRVASAEWPGVEIAVLDDKVTGRGHLAERTRRSCTVTPYGGTSLALVAFRQRVQELIAQTARAS